MKFHKVVLPLITATALGVGIAAVGGCQGGAQMQLGANTPPPPPPPPPPPAPPASSSAPVEAPAPPPPPPAKKAIQLRGIQMKSATQIDMPGDIEYQTGSHKIVLNDKSKKVLTTLATLMKDNPELTKLRIEGHTDNVGKDDANLKLSEGRAQSVSEWLTKNGVDAGRLVVKGYGASKPLVTNDTPEHKAQNRRTEFHVQEFNGQAVDADSGGTAVPATAPSASAAPSAAPAASAAPAPSDKDKDKDKGATKPKKP